MGWDTGISALATRDQTVCAEKSCMGTVCNKNEILHLKIAVSITKIETSVVHKYLFTH